MDDLQLRHGDGAFQLCLVFIRLQRNFVGGLQMGENFLATQARGDVRFAGDHFFGRQQALVVGGENFGVGAIRGWDGVCGGSSGSVGLRFGRGIGPEIAREGVFEIAFAIITRHSGLQF